MSQWRSWRDDRTQRVGRMSDLSAEARSVRSDMRVRNSIDGPLVDIPDTAPLCGLRLLRDILSGAACRMG